MIRIAAAQIDCILGDIAGNTQTHRRMIQQAAAQNIAVLLFPELSLTGYLLEDRSKEIALNIEEAAALFNSVCDCDMVVGAGFVERDRSGRIYNSCGIFKLAQGTATPLCCARKINLPTYGMFDEARHFSAGSELVRFQIYGIETALLICEDMWHPMLPIASALQKDELPGLILAPAASPMRGLRGERPSNLEGWEKNIAFFSSALGIYIINAQRVGVEDSLIFSGGSMITRPDGQTLRAELFKESLISVEFDTSLVEAKRQKTAAVSLADREIAKTILRG